MHVVELSEVAASAYDFDAYREARIEPACDQITTMVSETVGDATAIDEIVVTGSPEVEILKAAREHDADLIVMGAGAAPVSTGAGHTLEKVIVNTPCPVLVAGAPLAAVRAEPWPATRAADAGGTGVPGVAAGLAGAAGSTAASSA